MFAPLSGAFQFGRDLAGAQSDGRPNWFHHVTVIGIEWQLSEHGQTLSLLKVLRNYGMIQILKMLYLYIYADVYRYFFQFICWVYVGPKVNMVHIHMVYLGFPGI